MVAHGLDKKYLTYEGLIFILNSIFFKGLLQGLKHFFDIWRYKRREIELFYLIFSEREKGDRQLLIGSAKLEK